MPDHPKVAIFWDYENCSPPSSPCGLGYDIVNNIGRIARLFGSTTMFRAYLDISAQSLKSVALRSELQSSGVSIIDCPHSGKKDVVDKMILVDMLAFAVDHPAPATVILITGDRDYAYALSILKLRKYQVVLVVPSSLHTSPCLESQASLVIDWGVAALRTRTEAVNSTQVARQPYLDLDTDLTTKLLRELQEHSDDDPDTTLHTYSTVSVSQSASRSRRMSVRDLLEPSRHSKNAGSLDSTQEFAHNPASPRKSTSTANDSAPGGLPIPKTPSHSRSASVSTGSTSARGTTIVAQFPAAVEQDISAKNPPPSSAGRSSASDITDVAGPTKRGLSVLPSLDVLELPLNDSRPPSSIIIRSPLQPVQSTGDTPVPEKQAIPSSHRLNCLASPFVATKVPTGLESTPDPCSKQFHTTVKPTTPIVALTKPLTEIVTAVCETPQIRDVTVPEEIEHQTGLRIEDDDGISERSILHHRVRSQEGVRDAINPLRSNYDSNVVSHTMYSPSSRNVGLHRADTHSSKHVSPPVAITPGISEGVDSAQFAALLRASDTPDRSPPGCGSVLSSTTFPSSPSSPAESHETDDSEQRQMWTKFKPLIQILLAAHGRGIRRPSRSTVAVDLVQSDKQVYQRAGVLRFRDYTALAEQAGIIELGGIAGDAWIALHPNWFGVDTSIMTTHLSNRVPSPTSDPPKAIESPSLTDSKTSLIEAAAIFQTPTPASSSHASFESSNALPNSPIDRQDNASQASIPAHFQPLIDILTRMRTEGFPQTLRSLVGQMLGQHVYAQAGVLGFKEYIQEAWEAQLVLVGGVGGHAWIRLHPELRT